MIDPVEIGNARAKPRFSLLSRATSEQSASDVESETEEARPHRLVGIAQEQEAQDRMDPITPRELDATIKALDASWDARYARTQHDLEKRFVAIETQVKTITDTIKDIRGEGRSNRNIIITTVIVSAIGIVGLVATMLGAFPGFFESGRGLGAQLTELSTSVKALEAKVGELSRQAPPTAPPQPPLPATTPVPQKQ